MHAFWENPATGIFLKRGVRLYPALDVLFTRSTSLQLVKEPSHRSSSSCTLSVDPSCHSHRADEAPSLQAAHHQLVNHLLMSSTMGENHEETINFRDRDNDPGPELLGRRGASLPQGRQYHSRRKRRHGQGRRRHDPAHGTNRIRSRLPGRLRSRMERMDLRGPDPDGRIPLAGQQLQSGNSQQSGGLVWRHHPRHL